MFALVQMWTPKRQGLCHIYVFWCTIDDQKYLVPEPLPSSWPSVTVSVPARIWKSRATLLRASVEMMGFVLPPGSRGTWRSCSRSRQRQMGRRKNPSSFVASCLTFLPFASVLWTSGTRVAYWLAVLTGPSTDGISFALSPQQVSFVLPSPHVAAFPLCHSDSSLVSN